MGSRIALLQSACAQTVKPQQLVRCLLRYNSDLQSLKLVLRHPGYLDAFPRIGLDTEVYSGHSTTSPPHAHPSDRGSDYQTVRIPVVNYESSHLSSACNGSKIP